MFWMKGVECIEQARRLGGPEEVAMEIALYMLDPYAFYDDSIFELLTDEEMVLLDMALEKLQVGGESHKVAGSLSKQKWNSESVNDLLNTIYDEQRYLDILHELKKGSRPEEK